MDIQGLLNSAATDAGLDPDFVTSIAKAESNFNPNAVSPKGAVGVMQLMPSTAKNLGVDPHDPEQNIRGGVKYLAQLADQFNGDPVKVAAAYNAGPGRVAKFNGVPPYAETQGYVKRVMGNYQPSGMDAGTEDNGHSASFNSWVQSIGGKPAASRGQAPQPPAAEDVPPPPPSLESIGLKPGWNQRNDIPQSPPPLSAGAQAARDAALAHKGSGVLTVGDRTIDLGGLANQVVNPAAFSALPYLHAGLNAASQGISNFVAPIAPMLGGQAHDIYGNPISGKSPTISMADQFAGTLAAENQSNQQFQQQHPRAALAANVAGMVSPEGAFNAVTQAVEKKGAGVLAKYAPQAAKTLVGKAAPALAGVGLASAGQAGVEGAEEGEDLGQIAQRAAVSGLTAVPMAALGMAGAGALGRLSAKAIPASATPMGARVAQIVSKGAGYGAAGALTGGVTSVLNGGDFVHGMIGPGVTGALVGMGGEAINPHEAYNKVPDARDRALALDDLGATGVTPEALAAAHPDATVADLTPNAQALIRHAANYGSDVYPRIQGAMEARQAPHEVGARTAADLSETGLNPDEAEVNFRARQNAIEKGPQSVTALTENKQQETAPGPTAERVSTAYQEATGIDPAAARAKAEADADQRQTEEVNPAYQPVMTNEGVNSPDIEHLGTVDPLWKKALNLARTHVLQRGMLPFVDNPRFGAQGDLAAPESVPGVQNGVPDVVPPGTTHLGTEVPPEVRQTAEDLKAGKAFRPKGKNLVTFLRDLGGIKGDGGEITGIFGGNKGAPLAAAGKGVGMDEAARSAKEAGYPVGDPRAQDAGPQDLIDALDNHVRKGALYPDTPENRALAERRAAVERAHEQLNELGVDHQHMSVDDVANALHNHERYAADNLPPPHEGENQPEHASPEDYYSDREKDWEDYVAGNHREPELPPEPGASQPVLTKEPRVIPTKALLVRAKQEYDALHRVSGLSTRFDAVVRNNWINPILDAHIPGYGDARAVAGDAISNRESFGEGYGLHDRGKTADQASQVAADFLGKSEGDQQKMREGYLAREHRILEDARVKPGDHANNPFHQAVRRTLFGEDAATKMEDALKLEQQKRNERPEARAADLGHKAANEAGQSAIKHVPDPKAFSKDWEGMTSDQQQAYREGLLTAVNLKANGAASEQASLFKKLQGKAFVAHLTTVLGPEATAKLQETAAREQAFAKTAAEAKSAGKTGKPQAHVGVEGPRAFVQMLLSPTGMTPGRANALGEIMSSKASDIAGELRARQALKGTKADEAGKFQSALSPVLGGLAGLAGTRLAAVGQNGLNH